jgi:hypothetical protein
VKAIDPPSFTREYFSCNRTIGNVCWWDCHSLNSRCLALWQARGWLQNENKQPHITGEARRQYQVFCVPKLFPAAPSNSYCEALKWASRAEVMDVSSLLLDSKSQYSRGSAN